MFSEKLIERTKSYVEGLKSKEDSLNKITGLKFYQHPSNKDMLVVYHKFMGLITHYIETYEYMCVTSNGRLSDCDDLMEVQDKLYFYDELEEIDSPI
jgi:hypothetical protein